MSNVHYASLYRRIFDEQVEKVCPVEFAAFLLEAGVALPVFAQYYAADEADCASYDELPSDTVGRIHTAFKALTDRFHSVTGMELHLCWVEDGFYGSDVSEEPIWSLTGV
jgi:hypothetical protein